MTYDDLLKVKIGSIVSYKEYVLDRHEKRHLQLEINNAVVHSIIPPNSPLNLETLEEYYGKDLEIQEYVQLSAINCLRIVLNIGVDADTQLPLYKPLLINQDFYQVGLQQIEVINSSPAPIEPNYMLGVQMYRTEVK